MATKVVCLFLSAEIYMYMYKKPIGAVCSESTLFASILKFLSNARQLFAADDFNRRHFQMHLFLGALKVNSLPTE